MAHFIDRRQNAKGKSTVNRQRFIRRYKQQIKKAVSDAMSKRNVTDIDKGESVGIPAQDISEPSFHAGRGGKRERVHPGNDQFSQGDRIPKPKGGNNGSGQGDASDSGEGEDDFTFQISKDEYLDLLFEDLALPNLKKNQLDKLVQYKTYRAGYTSDGVATNLDIVRSMKGSMARRIALNAGKKKKLKQLENELLTLKEDKLDHELDIIRLEKDIEELKRRIKAVPFLDTFDLKFRNFEKRPVPTSKAVMFCLMDVSGSMDQATKDIAKRFYILLYSFLSRSYKDVDVVYIRHHSVAKEVDEQEFFYSQETGGTVVSSALKLMQDIVQERYPSDVWNIYAAQASDGDNWAADSPQCNHILAQSILPIIRYYAYIEITDRQHQSLWHEYEKLTAIYDNFVLKQIETPEDIYPIFCELFKRQAETS
jgi:uncharacterized sporulation protein YeaH/YhbH (DUF444 family)